MILNKKKIAPCFFLLLIILTVDARRLKKYRKHKARHNVDRATPLLRQITTGAGAGPATFTGTGAATGAGTAGTITVNPTNNGNPGQLGTIFGSGLGNIGNANPSDALVLLNPTETASTPRLFKGLIFQALMGSTRIKGGGGGSNIPYIIVNVPSNITNINQNNLNNTRRAVAPAAITTPTTIIAPTTGTTTRRRVYQPLPAPQPTQVYQQRGSEPGGNGQDRPQNFILSPSNQLVPVYLPPEIQNAMRIGNGNGGGNGNGNGNVKVVRRRRRPAQRRRVQKKKQNVNPFAAFADSLRGIQYLY